MALIITGLLGGYAACTTRDERGDDDDGSGARTTSSTSDGASGGATGGTDGAGASSGTGGDGSGGTAPCGGHFGEAEPPEMAGMTAAHNAIRCAVPSPPAGQLPMLQWSSSLASYATDWANHLASWGCPLQHSSGPYGENLFKGSSTYQPEYVVGAWADEISCFSYQQFPGCCSCTCGHYTQIVWRDTTEVGCGMATCPGGGQVWSCSYDPPGNYLGQMPY